MDPKPKDAESENAESQNLTLIYILACFGMIFQITLELLGLYSLGMPLLSYTSIDHALILRLAVFFSWLVFSIYSMAKANLLFQKQARFLVLGMILIIPALAVSFYGHFVGEAPFLLSLFSWCLFGVGTGLNILGWYTFLSLLPTRETVKVVSLGSVLGTIPFLILASTNNILLSLIGSLLAVEASFVVLLLLMRIVRFKYPFSTEEFNSCPPLSWGAALSICMHCVLYGFMIITLFSLGIKETLIGVASGMIGGTLTIFFNRIERTRYTDIGFVQRITLPPITLCMLLIPMLGSTGRLVCCCLVNAAYALFITSGYGRIIVENAEFSLSPVKRISEARIPTLIGFCAGSIIGYLTYFVYDISDYYLMLITILITCATVSAFVFYISDDFKIRRELESLLMSGQDDEEIGQIEQKALPYFRICCEEIAQEYGLSQREGEVLVLLAKGRNANYIQKKLYVANSTVRTHIYHIYRKLGITSQQQIMDLIDAHYSRRGE